jgi:hypothetical protein
MTERSVRYYRTPLAPTVHSSWLCPRCRRSPRAQTVPRHEPSPLRSVSPSSPPPLQTAPPFCPPPAPCAQLGRSAPSPRRHPRSLLSPLRSLPPPSPLQLWRASPFYALLRINNKRESTAASSVQEASWKLNLGKHNTYTVKKQGPGFTATYNNAAIHINSV